MQTVVKILQVCRHCVSGSLSPSHQEMCIRISFPLPPTSGLPGFTNISKSQNYQGSNISKSQDYKGLQTLVNTGLPGFTNIS